MTSLTWTTIALIGAAAAGCNSTVDLAKSPGDGTGAIAGAGGLGGASNGGASTGLTGGTLSSGGQGGDGGDGGDGSGGRPPVDPCSEEALGTLCDAPLSRCALEPIDGIPCCFIAKVCEGGVVEWPVVCDDSCGQNCELVQNPMHCDLLLWCTWGGNDGCLSLPG